MMYKLRPTEHIHLTYEIQFHHLTLDFQLFEQVLHLQSCMRSFVIIRYRKQS